MASRKTVNKIHYCQCYDRPKHLADSPTRPTWVRPVPNRDAGILSGRSGDLAVAFALPRVRLCHVTSSHRYHNLVGARAIRSTDGYLRNKETIKLFTRRWPWLLSVVVLKTLLPWAGRKLNKTCQINSSFSRIAGWFNVVIAHGNVLVVNPRNCRSLPTSATRRSHLKWHDAVPYASPS